MESIFPVKETQFGRSVNFLDINVYFDDDNKLHYRLYTKPTDSRSYLNPKSFHPKHVFHSVPFSQMMRIMNRNTKEETREEDITQVKTDFMNSGYNRKILDDIEHKACERITTEQTNMEINMDENTDTIVFTIDYFEEFDVFKKVVKSVEEDLSTLFNNVKIKVTCRKSSSIGNMFIQNKRLCIQNKNTGSQKCGHTRCLTCPLMITSNSIPINGIDIKVRKDLNCKSKNCIYLCICKKCPKNNAYFGQTVQEHHNRMSSHRQKFCIDKFTKSALSMHAYDAHGGELTLNDFDVAVISKVPPRRLNREEFVFIDKFQTKTKGLNRYQVVSI